MAGYAVKQIDDMEAAYGGGFKRARAELGVESFGIQVLDFPPNADQYPEHDHTHDGQEEVYVPMSGRGEIEIDGERYPLEPGVMVRVGPEVKRKLFSGEEPMRVLALGGVPGEAYDPAPGSNLGAKSPRAPAT